jgi:ribulose-phosphate 3-epimerase
MVAGVKRIAASILAADFATLGDEVRAITDAGVDWIHVDVMDGHFVPNLTIGPQVVAAVRKHTSLPLDVHLMIEQPERYLSEFASAGADYLSVHVEACPHLHATVQAIRRLNVRPAVVLNPATPLGSVEMILADVEMILLMSVNPGFGGQAFIDSCADKIAALDRVRRERALPLLIEVDGGIKDRNAGRVAGAGADVLVIGTGLFGEPGRDYAAAVRRVRAAIGVTT